jgi:hypothetical protein
MDRYNLLTEKYEKVVDEKAALQAEIDKVWKKNLEQVVGERDALRTRYGIALDIISRIVKDTTPEEIGDLIESEIMVEIERIKFERGLKSGQ